MITCRQVENKVGYMVVWIDGTVGELTEARRRFDEWGLGVKDYPDNGSLGPRVQALRLDGINRPKELAERLIADSDFNLATTKWKGLEQIAEAATHDRAMKSQIVEQLILDLELRLNGRLSDARKTELFKLPIVELRSTADAVACCTLPDEAYFEIAKALADAANAGRAADK